METKGEQALKYVALAQSVYFVPTGVWSIVGLKSFQKVTGPKVDTWLVQTVGALVIAIGSALGYSFCRGEVPPESALVGAGSAAALAGIDVVYVARKRISPIYLLDALAEAGLIALWAVAWRLKSRRWA